VIRKMYQKDWCARGLYHMLLNSAMGFDAMIEATLGATGLSECSGETVGQSIGTVGESC
jgi:hypothetical protein